MYRIVAKRIVTPLVIILASAEQPRHDGGCASHAIVCMFQSQAALKGQMKCDLI